MFFLSLSPLKQKNRSSEEAKARQDKVFIIQFEMFVLLDKLPFFVLSLVSFYIILLQIWVGGSPQFTFAAPFV